MDRSINTSVSGDKEGGFIVDMHDGENHLAHISHADTMDEARDEGHDRFNREFGQDDDGGSADEPCAAGSDAGEFDDLKERFASLEARVGGLEKNRQALKSEQDRELDDENERLRTEAEEHRRDNERLLADAQAERERNKLDAHGRTPGEDGPKTAATMKASDKRPDADPDVERDRAQAVWSEENRLRASIDSGDVNEAEGNAKDAGTLGADNPENHAASSETATYAAPQGAAPGNTDRASVQPPAAPHAPLSASEHERMEELMTQPEVSDDERGELDGLRKRAGTGEKRDGSKN